MFASTKENWFRTPVLSITTTMVAICVLAGFLRAVLIVPLHVPLDPNEGWNAYNALAASTTGNPYPPAGSFMFDNYPPLSFYLIGAFGTLLGDNVVAGRLVSLAAFVTVCACIAAALRQMRADWSVGIFAAALLASTLLLTSDYVGMNDPQLLGHALQLVGLLCALHRPRATLSLVASALFFVVGGFVKHNLIVLPSAIAIWLVVVGDRDIRFRQAAIFVGASLLFFSLGLFAAWTFIGVDLLRVLNSPRATSFAQLGENLRAWLPVAAVPLTGFALLPLLRRRDEAVWLVCLYAALSIVWGIVISLGAGVDVNVMFDADIALALCVGMTVWRTCDYGSPVFVAAAQAYALLCIVPLAVIALRSSDWRISSFWLHPMRAEAVMARNDIAFLRARAGPAMCEDLTFCYWAGKAASVDVFNLNQRFETGAQDAAPFLRLIRSHYFSSIELDETNPFPLPKIVETTFFENYRIDHQNDEGTFFVRRS